MHVKEQTLTDCQPIERMKYGLNEMIKCVNCNFDMLLGKYLELKQNCAHANTLFYIIY